MKNNISLLRIAKILNITYPTALRWRNGKRDGKGYNEGFAKLVEFLTSLEEYELKQIFGDELVEKSYDR